MVRHGSGPVPRRALMAVVPAMVLGVAACAPTPPPQLGSAGAGTPTTSAPAPAEAPTASASPSPVGAASGTQAAPASSTPSSPAASASASSAASPSGSAAPSSSIAPGVKNLALTPDLARQILIAAATFNKLPVTAYTGLVPGLTFAGRDAHGATWVGTALEPSPSSVPAQVSVQDDGSYLLLERPAGGEWRVWSVGLASAADCARFGLPGDLRTLWGWPATGCRPRP